jgi:hypothetical protein
MTRAVVLATLALAVTATAPSAEATPTHAPSRAAATAAFGRLLHRFYGGTSGYWTCLAPPIGGRRDCFAEVHTGRDWHQVAMSARTRHGVIVFMTLTNVAAHSWVRHWWPYSHRFIFRSGMPGVASVNSSAYDWGWLAGCARRVRPDRTSKCGAYDGNSAGLSRFYTFRCARHAHLVTCTNRLGDAMRYRP